MRARYLLPAVLAATLVAPATASADFAHTVTPGESLYSIAAADGLTVSQLAAANGLSANSPLVKGSVIQIPPQGAAGAGAAVPASTSVATSGSSATACDPDGDGDNDGCGASAPAGSTSSAGGSYVVQPGDTLSAIAARAGTTVAQLAAANGLRPNGVLLSGSTLTLSGGGSSTVFTSTAAGQPVGAAAEGSSNAPPYPTPERVSAGEVGQIAADNGVPGSLADAIAWQESGFNNDLVSPADARGVMQILPGTWAWIQQNLAGQTLAPASAADNVRGGVLLLRSLLNSSGGDPSLAAAGYFQGWSSVQQHGLFPSTKQYVRDVTSLESQFGGG